jgi:hypothetical protein
MGKKKLNEFATFQKCVSLQIKNYKKNIKQKLEKTGIIQAEIPIQ